MTRFLHCADLHIDSPLRGLSSREGAPADTIRAATRRAVEGLVELAIAERVGLVLIAGDVFDGDWKDYSSGLYLRGQLGRLREAGIEVVLIHGNHDAASVITRRLSLPGVHVLSHQRPETVCFDDLGIAVHGQSFAGRAVTENLAATYPVPVAGLTNVGVLHTSLSGDPGHDRYAPCELAQLVAHGYDYWALGHIHERRVLHRAPYVVYPGNLQGRHMRECGPRGATIVEVGDDGLTLHEHALDVVRWTRAAVDLDGVDDETDLLTRADRAFRAGLRDAGGRLMAVRLELVGATDAAGAFARDRERLEAELIGLAEDIGSEQIWTERIEWAMTPARRSPVGDEALAVALDVLAGADRSDADLGALIAHLQPLARKLPNEIKQGPDGIDPADPEVIRRALAEARAMLPSFLLERAA